MPHRVTTFRYRLYNGLLLLAVAVVMATSLLSQRAASDLQQSVEKASHSQQVLAQINRFWGLLGNSDRYRLRYLLTGEARELADYRLTHGEMNEAVAVLRVLTADNPAQTRHIESLYRLHTRRAQFAATTQEFKRAALRGDLQAQATVERRIRDPDNHNITADLQAVVAAMIREEQALLAQRNEQRNQMLRESWATVLIANGLALVAGLVGYSATRRMQGQAQEALRAQLQAEQARRSSRDKSLFLASMSHEVRTPMNAIFGFTNLLADAVTDPTQARYVESIKKSGQALLSLINDVLDLSKMEAGKLELHEEPTDLREIVDQTFTMFEQAATDKGITLRVDYEGRAELPLHVDPIRLRQVLINLVSNAIKYTESGGVIVRIVCAACPRDGHCDLRIEVVDTGTGIPAHQLGVIFEPFEQGDSPDGKHREGTGLGLSITRRLVDLMGGSLRAESTLGEGSRFIVEVPERRLGAADTVPPPTVDPALDPARLPPLEVLVVDDVAWNRELVAAYLGGSRHQIRQAVDGLDAIREVRRKRPDVVLMDLRMPQLSGEQAMLRIRRDPASATLPIIAVTASSMVDDDAWLRRNFDGYVRKPYTRAELISALAAHFPLQPDTGSAAGAVPAGPDAVSAGGPQRVDDAALAEFHALRRDELPVLRARLRMREIGELAGRWRAQADALDWPELQAHAEALANAVESFDLALIKRLIDSCPVPKENEHD